jgi:hypothetical protein
LVDSLPWGFEAIENERRVVRRFAVANKKGKSLVARLVNKSVKRQKV